MKECTKHLESGAQAGFKMLIKHDPTQDGACKIAGGCCDLFKFIVALDVQYPWLEMSAIWGDGSC